MGFILRENLEKMGFARLGKNVLLSEKASYYNCSKISLGDNIRIDDFCVLSAGSGGIVIGNFVHIAVFSLIIGSGKITLADFCGLSSNCKIYSSSDDYSGSFLTNPMVSDEFKNVQHADVNIGKHVIIGSGSIVLPGVTLEEGVAIGALSLVSKNCSAFGIYAGVPVRRLKERKRELLKREEHFLMANIE